MNAKEFYPTYHKRQRHEEELNCANCGSLIYKEVYPTYDGRAFCNDECWTKVYLKGLAF